MKITFINLPCHKTSILTSYPPLGILLMSSVLKEKGHNVYFIDADVNRLNVDQIILSLLNDNPDVIGISLNILQIPFLDELLEKIYLKIPNAFLVAGGPYVTSIKEKIFTEFPKLKYAITNEGEFAIVDFLEFLQGKREISSVRNLIYSANGIIKKNFIERINDIDSLPLPDYDLVSNFISKYYGPDDALTSPSLSIICSRGCPYECTFCASSLIWDRKITFRKVDSVIKEIKFLREKFDVKEIYFLDDTLNLRKEWFIELCDKIIENGFNKDIFFRAPFRVNKNLLTTEVVKKAKEANFWLVFFGIESGNIEILKNIKKKIEISEVKRAFKIMRKFGIATFGAFMIGNPGETEKTVAESIKLFKNLMPDFGSFSIAVPFPGTEFNQVSTANRLIIDSDFKNYEWGKCISFTEKLSIQQIYDLHSKALREISKIHNSFLYKIRSRKIKYLLKKGIYPKEYWDVQVNRAMKKGFINIFIGSKPKNNILIKFLIDHPDLSKKSVTVQFKVGKFFSQSNVTESKWFEEIIPLPENTVNQIIQFKWIIDRSWNPKDYGSTDDKEIGITFQTIKAI